MYKREEGVNYEVVGVWLQNMILSFLLFIGFLFCIYIAEEHTRHVSMWFTVAVECVLPYNKHSRAPGEETHTQATG